MGSGDENSERTETHDVPAALRPPEDSDITEKSDKAGDSTPTTDLGSATVKLVEDDPDRSAPYIGTYLYNDADDEDDARYALAHQRGPGLWLPLVVFGVLLAVGAALGHYLLPDKPTSLAGPSTPVVRAAQPTATAVAQPPAPPLPALPTPPARPADALADWAGHVSPVIDVPVVAVEAYGYAQLTLAQKDPGCHLGWTTLAGVGEVQSDHGRINGAVVQPNGRATPPIVGPTLNGKNGAALVPDTDAGAFDGDPTYDHAMGPLLLLPSMWSTYGVDADGDGILDPYDIDDAALALGGMLCSGNDDMAQLGGWRTAIGRFQPGEAYAKSVFEAADRYGQLTKSIG